MNRTARRSRLVAAGALLLCAALWIGAFGCSGPAPKPVPAAKEKAASWNRRGLAAEKRGDSAGAISAFREELKIRRSVEDDEGAAVALINLARVQRLQNKPAPAEESIDAALRLVLPGNPLFPEAAFEKGMTELAAGNLPAARGWAEKAVKAETGASSGRMLNLLARVLFLEGRIEEAKTHAAAALEANRAAGARAEEANSLRLLGDAAAAGGDGKGAEDLYLKALSIDKEIAASSKIAADLRALGAAAASRGETERAIAFYERAAEVSRNGDDAAGAGEARKEMERLRKP